MTKAKTFSIIYHAVENHSTRLNKFPGVAQLVARLLWVRLRARPVDDTASITKRSGQNISALQAVKCFGYRKRATKANQKFIYNIY